MDKHLPGVTGLLFFLVSLFCALLFSAQPARAAPSVIINELLWMGSSTSSSDEWIELHNTTTTPIDLTGWSLTKLSGGASILMLTIPSGSIPAGDYFLIANDPAATSRLAVEPQLVNTSMSLVNSKLQVSLYDAAGTLVDRADDGVGNPAAGEYASGSVWKSMERNATGENGTKAESWHTASVSVGFDDGLKEFGTPGSQNSNAAPTVAFVAPDSVTVNSNVQFDASETVDPENDPLLFQWDFGDGTAAVGSTASHAYSVAGTYTVRLTASDGQATATTEHSIVIASPPEPSSPDPAPPQTPSSDSQNMAPVQTHVRVSELLPNPTGSDTIAEYVELENVGDEEVDLAGWTVSDGVSSYTITAGDVGSTLIAARGFFVLSRSVSGIALNNSGSETVTLASPEGRIIDTVTYTAPIAENASYSRFAEQWQWTTVLTPGQVNAAATTPSDPSSDAHSSLPALQTSRFVLLNEVLPNPAGSDVDGEFIEVVNTGKEQVNLRGWKVTTTTASFVFDRDVMIEAGEIIAFFRPTIRLALPNTQPTSLFLVDPFGSVVSGVQYPRSVANKSFSRFGKHWSWTEPSPNAVNRRVQEPVVHEQDVHKDAKTKTAKPFVRVALADFPKQPRGGRVLLRGTVNAPFGLLGANFLSLQEGGAAVVVQIMSAEPLDVDTGDVVTARGIVGQLDGQKKLNMASAEDVQVVGHTDTVLPVPLGDQPPVSGILATVQGTVARRRGSTATIQAAGQEWSVVLKTTNVDPQSIAVGAPLTVQGVVRITRTGVRLYPRDESDVDTQSNTTAVDAPSTVQVNIPDAQERGAWPLLSIGAPFAASAGALGLFWYKRRRHAA